MKLANMEVRYINHMGDDNSVVNAARVSFAKQAEQYTEEQNAKLINYLAKHNHKSPFNHCFLSFYMKAPLFCARQLVKHEYLPWNEVSRRYVDDEPECYLPSAIRLRPDSSIKQGSGKDMDKEGNEYYVGAIATQFEESLELYNAMLDAGIAPEQARMVLPQNVMTEWYWSGSLFAFIKMLKLRLDPHAQLETQEAVKPIADIISNLFPVSYQALMEN